MQIIQVFFGIGEFIAQAYTVRHLGGWPIRPKLLALLTLELEDYASTKKIAQLLKKHSTMGEPTEEPTSISDTSTTPQGAIWSSSYRDFGYVNELIKLGHIDGDLAALHANGSVEALIELPATN